MRTVCRLTGIPPWRIRHYARRGLLGELARKEGGERLFTHEQIERLCAIDRWTAAGWDLKTIRAVLGDDAGAIDEEVQRLAREIHEKTEQLEELREYHCHARAWNANITGFCQLEREARHLGLVAVPRKVRRNPARVRAQSVRAAQR